MENGKIQNIRHSKKCRGKSKMLYVYLLPMCVLSVIVNSTLYIFFLFIYILYYQLSRDKSLVSNEVFSSLPTGEMECTWNSVYSRKPGKCSSQNPSSTSTVSELIRVLPKGAILDCKIYNARYSKDTFKRMWEELIGVDTLFTVIEGYETKNDNGTCIGVLTSSNNAVIMVSGLDLDFLDSILLKDECSFNIDSLVSHITENVNQSLSSSVERGFQLFQYLCYRHIERKVMWLHVNKHKLYLKTLYDKSIKIIRLISNNKELYEILYDYNSTIIYGEPGSGKTYEINNLIFSHGSWVVYLRMLDLDFSDYTEINNFLKGSNVLNSTVFEKIFFIDNKDKETFITNFKKSLIKTDNQNARKIIFCFDGIDLVPEVNWEILKQLLMNLKPLPAVQTLITARRKNSFLDKYLKNLESDSFQTINLSDIQENDLIKTFEVDYLINKHSDNFKKSNPEQLERTFEKIKDLVLKYTRMPDAIKYFQAAFPFLINHDQITPSTFIELYQLFLRKSLNDLHVEEVYYYPLEDQYQNWIKAVKQYIFQKRSGENVELNCSNISRKCFMNNSDNLAEFLFAEYFHGALSPKNIIHGQGKVDDLTFCTMIFTQSQFYFVRALLDKMVEGMELISNWNENELKSFNRDKVLSVLIEENRLNIIRMLSKLRLGENALRITAREGNKTTLKILITIAPNLSEDRSEENNALLHVATINDQDIIELLSSQLQDKDDQDRTALHLAVQNDEIKLVKEILGESADTIDYQNKAGETALNIAAKQDFLPILKYLIEKNANLEVADNDGFTPFLSAVVSGNNEAVLHLIDVKCRTDVECKLGFKAIHYGAGKTCFEIVSSLIKNNKDVLDWVSRKQQFTALHIAASTDHLKIVEILVENGSNINALDFENRTPLHVAAGMEAFNVVEYLISEKCSSVNINARCKSDYTPLHLAAKNGDSEIVKLFIDNRKNDLEINTRNAEGLTPMHSALNCAENVLSIVNRCLIENRFFDINSINKWDETLLSFGIRQEIDVIESYFSFFVGDTNTEIKNQDGYNCFHFAAFQGYNMEVLKDKLKSYDDLNSLSQKGYTPLYIVAACQSHREIVKLLGWGADITLYDENNVSPLHLACYYDKYTMVDILGERYAKDKLIDIKTNNGWTALHFAIYSGSIEVARLLLRKYKADLYIKDENKYTALHVAAYYSRLNIVEMLLDRMIEAEFLNFQTKDGSTALNLAAQQGGIDTVRLLLESDADAKLADNQGFLPIHSAAYQGDTKILEYLLLKEKNTLEKRTKRGSTPLFLAVKQNRIEVVKLFLKHQAQICVESRFSPFHLAALKGYTALLTNFYKHDINIINVKDEIGRTALYLAAMEGERNAVDLLLEKGADVNIRQNKGWYPIHIAAYQGHIEIVETIVDKKGVDCVNVLTKQGDSPLHFAAWTGNKPLIEYLVGRGKNTDKNHFDMTPLDFAVSRGYAHIHTDNCVDGCKQCILFKLFDDKGYKLSFLSSTDNDSNIEYEVVRRNKFESIEYLVTELKSNFKQPIWNKSTPLHAAVARRPESTNVNSHLRILKYLGELKCDLNVVIEELEETPLYVAVMDGALASVKTLVEMGADASIGDQNGWTPLHAAVKCNNPQIVDYLCLNCKYLINIGSHYDLTALYVGVQYSCLEAVHQLMKHLADPTIPDKNGWNPLKVAEYVYFNYNPNEREKYKILYDDIKFYTNNYTSIRNSINQRDFV